MRCVALVLVVCAACGDEVCSRSDIDGTYMAEWTRVSGDCAPPPDGLVMLTADQAAPAECTTVEDNPSENDCRVDSVFFCDYAAENTRVHYTSIFRQRDEGREMTATVSVISSYLSSGVTICTGTLEAKYTRQ